MNIYLASHIVAFILGIISRHHNRAFAICMVLSVPGLWLFAWQAPKYTGLPRANHDGFLNFYIKIYEGLSPKAMMAVILFPVIFIAGRWAYAIYKIYFYRPKTESPKRKKKRVYAMYGVTE